MKTDTRSHLERTDFIPSKVNLDKDPMNELRRIIMEWVDNEKLAALDEWVSIPFTVLPIPVFLLTLLFQGKTALITSMSLGLTLVFWVTYKIGKAKRAVDIRLFVIAYSLQSLVYLAFFAVLFTIISLPSWNFNLRFPFETIFKVEIATISTLFIPIIMKQWGYGPWEVVEYCWHMIAKDIENSSPDSWKHRREIQTQVKNAACQLSRAMMRPGATIAFSIAIPILLVLAPEPGPAEVLTFTVMLTISAIAGIHLTLRHVGISQEKAGNHLENVAEYLDLLHDILESQCSREKMTKRHFSSS